MTLRNHHPYTDKIISCLSSDKTFSHIFTHGLKINLATQWSIQTIGICIPQTMQPRPITIHMKESKLSATRNSQSSQIYWLCFSLISLLTSGPLISWWLFQVLPKGSVIIDGLEVSCHPTMTSGCLVLFIITVAAALLFLLEFFLVRVIKIDKSFFN